MLRSLRVLGARETLGFGGQGSGSSIFSVICRVERRGMYVIGVENNGIALGSFFVVVNLLSSW